MSDHEILTLPFQVHRLWYRVYGLLRLEAETLYIELQIIDNITGLLRSRIRTLAVPLTDITALQLEKGWLGTASLRLRTCSLQPLKRFPSSQSGECVLPLRRRDWPLAETMCQQIEWRQSELRLKKMEQAFNQQLGAAPPLLNEPATLWNLARRQWVKIFPPGNN